MLLSSNIPNILVSSYVSIWSEFKSIKTPSSNWMFLLIALLYLSAKIAYIDGLLIVSGLIAAKLLRLLQSSKREFIILC